MPTLSKTAANKLVRQLQHDCADIQRLMHEALEYAIGDMFVDTVTNEISGAEYVGALKLLARAQKHQSRMLEGRYKNLNNKTHFWGYGIYSPVDNLKSRIMYRERLEEV